MIAFCAWLHTRPPLCEWVLNVAVDSVGWHTVARARSCVSLVSVLCRTLLSSVIVISWKKVG